MGHVGSGQETGLTSDVRVLRMRVAGELVARCEGPTKSAQCQLVDNHDGTFTLDVTAAEAGRHIMSIEYDGQHTAGNTLCVHIVV